MRGGNWGEGVGIAGMTELGGVGRQGLEVDISFSKYLLYSSRMAMDI